jgi:hypothetical protein
MAGGGNWNGPSLSKEPKCGGPLGRAPILRTLEDMLRKALYMGLSLHSGTIEEPGGNSLAGTFKRKG